MAASAGDPHNIFLFWVHAAASFDTTVGGRRLLLAPVPWLPDAPRGAAVWGTAAGLTSTSWAVRTDLESGHWSVWVNVTVPAAGGAADVKVMVPQSAQRDAVCASRGVPGEFWPYGFDGFEAVIYF